jgi:hypothetical protein
MFVIKATPLNIAYNDENHFPEVVLISNTGPIPDKIIEALCRLSSQDASVV